MDMMKHKWLLAFNLFYLLPLLLIGCAGAADPTLLPASPHPESSATPASEEPAEQPDVGFPLSAKPLAQMAAIDLAARTAIPVEKITLLSVQSVEWPDAGIGCPEEGYDYAQVITPGYKIVLQAEGTLFTYHSDQGTFVILCLDDGPESMPTETLLLSGSDLPVNRPDEIISMTITDLANRLGIDERAVTVLQVKPIEWPDATLGCPKPGMDFTPVITPGFIITLEVDGDNYVYHTDDVDRVILCPAEGERPDEIFIMP